MLDKHNKISIFVYISILINIIVLALFITFVFGLKKDAFDVDTKKLDRNALICQNSIVSLVNDYDNRLNKIVESYPFINFLQNVILNGIDESEKDRIISIFRSGNYPFDTVALYLADGKSVFSSPAKIKPINLEDHKNSKAFFDKDYDGVYFIKPIKNNRGIEVGYVVASVFKKIFENTSYNLNFVVLPNGVVYYNPSIDINSISRDTLSQYMNNDVVGSQTIDSDSNSYTFYSSKVKDIDNFSIGLLELNVPAIQKYLKYAILGLLTSSLIFLIITSLIEKNANKENDDEESENDEDIYDNEDKDIEYDNANIVNNDEEFNIDDYDIDTLDDDSIKYLNDINRNKITKKNKVDLPKIDEVEDIKIENNNEEDEILKLDNFEDVYALEKNEIPSLDSILEEDNKPEDSDIPTLDDVLEENADKNEDDDELEDVPTLDDILDEEYNMSKDMYDNEVHFPEMKEYSDDELLDSDNIIDDEENKEETNNGEENNIDDIVENLDDIPSLDDIMDEEEAKDEDNEEIKEYSDDELLDSDNIIDDEENKEETNNEEENNIDDTVENLDDIPSLDDIMNEEETKDDNNEEDLYDIPDLDDIMDDEEKKNENKKEEENNIIKGIDDIIDDNEGDILISHGSIIEDEIVKKEEEYFSSSDAFNLSLNRDFLLGDYDDDENSSNNGDEKSNLTPAFSDEEYDDEVVKPANENDTFETEDLIDNDLYEPEEIPKIPDDFYKEAEEKVKENMTSGWKNVLKAIRGKKFINKNMDDMLNWLQEQSGLDITHASMLTKKEDGNYEISESQNISDGTRNRLKINENEALFKKILSHKKTLYVSDPFSSESLKNKFDPSDRENISHMIFIPVENDEGGLKSFFIGLSSN
ncbi:AAA family ATPase [uncultured Brachyspira sp.]|uniref:AAA family ATPase n=1 Tax=uncultured Brachyspira sp. TaxID=221953 RepID=UPI002618E5FB|nr:AAA family ATPase [uncultured Brachyspira sp.]